MNARAIALSGIGFTAMAMASQGFYAALTEVVAPEIVSPVPVTIPVTIGAGWQRIPVPLRARNADQEMLVMIAIAMRLME